MLYVVMELGQKSWWHEYGCRYALALLEAGVQFRVIPYGRDVVEGQMIPQEFQPLLDTMLGRTEPCTRLLYIGQAVGAVELVSRGPGETPEEKYALVTWPTDSAPAGIVAGLNVYDRVIVPSEGAARALLRSHVLKVGTVPPPDPPYYSGKAYTPPKKAVLCMGGWGGLDNAQGLLHAFCREFNRRDNVMLHLVCPDIPFGDASGLEWEVPEKKPSELPFVSLARELPDAAGRAQLYRSCAAYATASRRMDMDPFSREATLYGLPVVVPTGLEREDSVVEAWSVPGLPCGADECEVRGVGFEQMWGDPDLNSLGAFIREAVERGPGAAIPRRALTETGSALEKLLVREAEVAVAAGDVALRVVVPHKDRGLEFVQPCLDALVPQLGTGDAVYLVDQESRPEVFSSVLTYCVNRGVAVVPSEPGPGGAWSLASARNAGIRYSDGPQSTHVVCLDCDCVVPPGFVPALKARIKESPAAILIPVVQDTASKEKRPATGLAVMSMELYRSVGGYDEGYYGWGSEDIDFLWRARKRLGVEGVVITDESMVISHIAHEPCTKRDEHGARNEQRFKVMTGGAE